MISVEQLIDRARSWVGVPFHHQGRNRYGVDCVGLPEVVLREAGVLPAGFRVRMDYGRSPKAEDLLDGLRQWCEPGPKVPGALFLMRWPTRPPSHVAIFTGTHLIHAYHPKGVIQQRYADPWTRRFVSAWKLPGVLYE